MSKVLIMSTYDHLWETKLRHDGIQQICLAGDEPGVQDIHFSTINHASVYGQMNVVRIWNLRMCFTYILMAITDGHNKILNE